MRLVFWATLLCALGSFADASLTAYGTYWSSDASGSGGGLRLKKTFLGFGAWDVRGGAVDFDDEEVVMLPLEASVNVRMPFIISPYVGVGAGYYILESGTSQLHVDNAAGPFAQLGVEATLLWFGAMAEVRFHEPGADLVDGTSFNLGVLLKW